MFQVSTGLDDGATSRAEFRDKILDFVQRMFKDSLEKYIFHMSYCKVSLRKLVNF